MILDGGRMTIKIDDSLNAHGGVGIDFWQVNNGCDTELFTLNVENALRLRNWLTGYLEKIK